MTVLPLGFLGDFVSGGRSNLIGVIPARFLLWKKQDKNKEVISSLSEKFSRFKSQQEQDWLGDLCHKDNPSESQETLVYREKKPVQGSRFVLSLDRPSQSRTWKLV